MIVINSGIHTSCIEVVKINEIPEFLKAAGQIMTGFITMAKGAEMVFPIEFLMNKIKVMLSEYVEFDKYIYVVRVKEEYTFNSFALYVTVFESTGEVIITDIEQIEMMKSIEEIKWTFSAIEKV